MYRSKVSGHRQEQLTQTSFVRLLKTHFLTPILDSEKNYELVAGPGAGDGCLK